MPTLLQTYLMATDLDRSRTFYEAGLGLEPTRVGDTSIAYETGECELMVQADFDPSALEAFNLSPPPDAERGAGAVYVVSMDDEIDAVYDRVAPAVEETAGEIVTEPRDVPWGEPMFLVRDPDGYILELRGAGD